MWKALARPAIVVALAWLLSAASAPLVSAGPAPEDFPGVKQSIEFMVRNYEEACGNVVVSIKPARLSLSTTESTYQSVWTVKTVLRSGDASGEQEHSIQVRARARLDETGKMHPNTLGLFLMQDTGDVPLDVLIEQELKKREGRAPRKDPHELLPEEPRYGANPAPQTVNELPAKPPQGEPFTSMLITAATKAVTSFVFILLLRRLSGDRHEV